MSSFASSECHRWIDEVSDFTRKVVETKAHISHHHRILHRIKRGTLIEEPINVQDEEDRLNSLRKDLLELKEELNDVITVAKEKCK